MVNDSAFETDQFFHVIDWFIFYANSTRKFDRSCLKDVLGIHSYPVISDDAVNFKGRPTVRSL